MSFRSAALAVAALILSVTGAVALPITKQVLIRPIDLCDGVSISCAVVNTYTAATEKIWSQAGIVFNFLPTQTWINPTFNTLDTNTGEDFTMFQAGSTLFGNPLTTGIINVYFVNTVIAAPGTTLFGEGCGGSTFSVACHNQAGVLISASDVNAFNGGLGRIDTIAHEVGHLLNLTHTDFGAGVCDNLMSDGNTRCVPGSLGDITPDGQMLDQITQTQLNVARRSPFLSDATPEPASLALLGFGLLATGLLRRRRT